MQPQQETSLNPENQQEVRLPAERSRLSLSREPLQPLLTPVTLNMWQEGFHSRILSLNAGRHASVTPLALSPHLNEVAQNGFVGQVTAEAVVPLQEVRSEMMQEGVEVQRVVTVLPAVNTLAALQNTHNSPPVSFTAVRLSFCCR